jgi:hypothetical protein
MGEVAKGKMEIRERNNAHGNGRRHESTEIGRRLGSLKGPCPSLLEKLKIILFPKSSNLFQQLHLIAAQHTIDIEEDLDTATHLSHAEDIISVQFGAKRRCVLDV